MSMRPHRRSLDARRSSVGPADRSSAVGFARKAHLRPTRWLAWMVLTHWRPILVAAGALLIVIWMLLPSTMLFVPGMLVVAMGAPGTDPFPKQLSATAAMVRMSTSGVRGGDDTHAT